MALRKKMKRQCRASAAVAVAETYVVPSAVVAVRTATASFCKRNTRIFDPIGAVNQNVV